MNGSSTELGMRMKLTSLFQHLSCSHIKCFAKHSPFFWLSRLWNEQMRRTVNILKPGSPLPPREHGSPPWEALEWLSGLWGARSPVQSEGRKGRSHRKLTLWNVFIQQHSHRLRDTASLSLQILANKFQESWDSKFCLAPYILLSSVYAPRISCPSF